MKTNRVVTATLSLVLLALLGWCIVTGVGRISQWAMLGLGAVLGLLYTVAGRLPDWIIDHLGGSISHDDNPSNISPRVYLPILLGVVIVAVIALIIVVRFF